MIKIPEKSLKDPIKEQRLLSRRYLIDKFVTDEDVHEALDVLKASVVNGDNKAAIALIDLAIGSKRDFDSMILSCQKNAMDMLKYLIEKGIGNGLDKDALLQLIQNFDISKFIPINVGNSIKRIDDDDPNEGGIGGAKGANGVKGSVSRGKGFSEFANISVKPKRQGERESAARQFQAELREQKRREEQRRAELLKRRPRIYAEDDNPEAW